MTLSKKTVLILGGFGFIGKNLIEDLLKQSTYSVIVLDRPGTSFGDPDIDADDKLKVYHGNFSDRILLQKIFTENAVDVVVHCVSTTIPATSNADMQYDIHSNLEGTIAVLEEMKLASVSNIVYFSSGGTVYGPGTAEHMTRGFHESDPTNPISSYGVVKLAIEKYLELYRYLYGVNYLVLRESNPYGPYHQSEKQGFINVTLRNVLAGKPITVWGDGSIVRDFIYVKDTAVILRDLLERDVWNKVFNMGSGEGYSIKEILGIIAEVVGDFDVNYEPIRSLDVPRAVLDIGQLSAATSIVGELTDIRKGISETYEWLKQNKLQ